MKGTFAILMLAVALASCRTGHFEPLRSGVYQGTPWRVEARSSVSIFSVTNSVDWRIGVGSLPPVPVDATTTDWGAPYSADVYGAALVVLIPGEDRRYANAPDTLDTAAVRSMLYVSPATLDRAAFDAFAAFMTGAWPGIADSVASPGLRGFPRIIGLVYGDRKRSVLEFRGAHAGAPFLLRVEPDGRVRLITDDRMQNEVWSGLSQKVQMPGKRLYLDGDTTGQGLTLAELRRFNTKAGATPLDLFAIEPRH